MYYAPCSCFEGHVRLRMTLVSRFRHHLSQCFTASARLDVAIKPAFKGNLPYTDEEVVLMKTEKKIYINGKNAAV